MGTHEGEHKGHDPRDTIGPYNGPTIDISELLTGTPGSEKITDDGVALFRADPEVYRYPTGHGLVVGDDELQKTAIALASNEFARATPALSPGNQAKFYAWMSWKAAKHAEKQGFKDPKHHK